MTRRIDISYRTIIFIAAFLLFLWILLQIIDILLLFFVAFIFMSALGPLVDRLVKWGVPKVFAVLLILVLFIIALAGIIALVTTGFAPLITESNLVAGKITEAFNLLSQTHLIDPSIIQQETSRLSGQVFGYTVDFVKNIISFVSLLVITLYMLLDREKIEEFGTSIFGSRQGKARRLLGLIEDKLGAWLRGQMILSITIGVLVYIGLLVLGVEFALPLAIIAGFLEVVPVLGPIISAIPAVLLALTVSPIFALIVAGMYFAIQQLEGHLIVPQVMRRAVGLNPLLVILAISVGGRLLGIGGALLAVPIAVVIQVVLQEGLKPLED